MFLKETKEGRHSPEIFENSKSSKKSKNIRDEKLFRGQDFRSE